MRDLLISGLLLGLISSCSILIVKNSNGNYINTNTSESPTVPIDLFDNIDTGNHDVVDSLDVKNDSIDINIK